ncbi:MAG TPA: DUF3084 domain-containing protein [Firmicutes bacterium]|nr:DUF3084 domain-containing protein [Bacillota bacterium]
MTFGLGFIALLLAVGGFAAYQGDRVGMLAGRRRVMLFGLRPRYTARVITVITGIIIVLITMVSMLLLSSNMRQALFGLDELRQAVTTLSEEVAAKNDDLSQLERQRLQLIANISELQKENEALEAQNKEWKDSNDQLKKENAGLVEERNRLIEERDRLEEERKQYEMRTKSLLNIGNLLYGQQLWLRQASIRYHRGDVLASCVVDTGLSAAELLATLNALVAEADEKVRQADPDTPGLKVEAYIPNQGIVESEVLIGAAVQAIRNAAAADPELQSVIVQLRVSMNAASGEAVSADFDLIRNVKVYNAGDVVLRRVFDGRMSPPEIFEEFYLFISTQVRQAVIEKGLLPLDARNDGVSLSDAYMIVEQIAAQNRSVELIAYAKRDCWTMGPLELAFRLQPVH